jgi:fatty acid desaturase
MAEELLLGRSQTRVKLRNPWAVALLPFITLGIYHLVWWYRVNREMRDFGEDRGRDLGQRPTNSLLALFPGSLIVIPPLVSYWRGTKRVMDTAGVTRTEPLNGWIALILFIVLSPAFWAYLQVTLNHAWVAADAAERGAPPLVEPSEPAAHLPASEPEPVPATTPDEPDTAQST